MKKIFLLMIMHVTFSLAAHAEPIQGGDKDTVWMRYTTESSVIVRISKMNKYIAKFGSYTNIYDFNTGNLIKQLPGGEWGFFINNDQNFIRVNQSKNGIEILDANTWQIIGSLPNEGQFAEYPFADVSRDENYMAVTTSNGFKIWDIAEHKLIATKIIPLYKNQINLNINAIKFDCSDNIILQVAKTYTNPNNPNNPYVEGCFTVFDKNTFDSIGCMGNGRFITLSNTCKLSAILVSTQNNGVQVNDLINHKQLWVLPTNGYNTTGMEFSPDDKYLFVSHQTGTDQQGMEVWDLLTGKMVYKYKSLGGGGYDCLNISYDGKNVTASRNILLYLYRTDGINGIIDPKNPHDLIYPNPTNGTINLEFVLPNPAITNISVINSTGKILKQFFNGFLIQGSQKLTYDTKGLPPGSYFVQIQNKTYSKIFKLIINK